MNEIGFTLKPDISLGKYRHYKGGLYEATDLSCDEETHEWRVTYRPLYETEPNIPDRWSRTVKNFTEVVVIDGQIKKRFEKIDD